MSLEGIRVRDEFFVEYGVAGPATFHARLVLGISRRYPSLAAVLTPHGDTYVEDLHGRSGDVRRSRLRQGDALPFGWNGVLVDFGQRPGDGELG